MSGLGRLRAVATTALSCAVVTVVATTAWAAPVAAEPTPVKDKEIVETAPTSFGSWFGWGQGYYSWQGYPPVKNFFVQRDGEPRIQVNEPGTYTSSAGILDGSVIYDQRPDSTTRGSRLFRYDLRTARRAPLADAVNRARWRGRPTQVSGDVSASGPWVLFTRQVVVPRGYGSGQVVLYNRSSRTLQVLDSRTTEHFTVRAGQVEGRYATFSREYLDPRSNDVITVVVRHDIRTGRETVIDDGEAQDADDLDLENVADPAVTADGTLYFWRSTRDRVRGRDTTWQNDLVRLPVGGTEETVFSLDDRYPYSGFATFAQRGAGGSTAVYFDDTGDIFRLDL